MKGVFDEQMEEMFLSASRTFLKPAGPPKHSEKKTKLKTDYFRDSRHVQLAKYIVLDKESESEVIKCKILEPGGEK